MDAQTFLDNFATIADAPSGVQRLRELVLELAVRGQLADQDPDDEPVAALLDSMPTRRDSLVSSGAIGKLRHPEGVAVDDPPHEIPASWVWARLGDVSAIVGGGTPKSGEPAYWADGPDIAWLTPADMRSQTSRLVSRGARDITANGLAESSAQLLPAGSVLFSSRAPIGHVGIAAQPLATNQGFKSCVPYISAMTEYLYLFLRYVGPIVDASATGTTFKEVSGKQVALIPVPVPPLAEQERIVAKVDELMDLCDDLEAHQERRHRATTRFRSSALHALTEAESPDDLHHAWKRVGANWPALTPNIGSLADLRGSILRLATMGWLTSQEADARDAAAELEELRRDRQILLTAELAGGNTEAATMMRKIAGLTEPDSPYPIPKGWTCTALIDLSSYLVDCHNKTAPYSRSGIPIVRTTNIKFGRLVWQDMKYVTNETYERWSQRLQPQPGDVLFTREAPMGEAAIVPPETQLCLGQRTMLIRPWASAVLPDYLLIALREPGLLERSAHLSIGSTVKHFRVGDVERLPIMLPPMKEQKRIVRTVDHLLNLCDHLEAALGRHDHVQMRLSAALTRT